MRTSITFQDSWDTKFGEYVLLEKFDGCLGEYVHLKHQFLRKTNIHQEHNYSKLIEQIGNVKTYLFPQANKKLTTPKEKVNKKLT